MATPTQNIGGGGGRKKVGGQSQDIQRALDATKEVLESLGLDPEKLGPNTRATAKRQVGQLSKQAKIADADLDAVSEALLEAHAQDLAAEYNAPKTPAAEAVRSWAKTSSVKEEGGQYALTGTAGGDSHPVALLLADLGINKDNLTPNVLDKLSIALERGTELSNPKEWNQFAKEMLMAKAADGDLAVGATKSVQKKATTTAAVPSAPIDGGDTGLEKTAPSTFGNGSAQGALHALMANMSASKGQDKGAQKAVGEAATIFAREAGIEDLSPQDARTIEKTLKSVVKDRGNPGGEIRSSAVMSNAFNELAELEQEAGGFGAWSLAAQMGAGLHEMVKTQGDAVSEPIENLMANMATFATGELVGAKLGRQPEMPEEVFGKLSSIMAELGGHEELPPEVETGTADPDSIKDKVANKKEIKKSAAEAANLPPDIEVSAEAKAAAADALASMNLEPNNPDCARIKAAFEQVFARGMQPHEVAVNCAALIDAHLGTNQAHHTKQLINSNPDSGMIDQLANKGLAQLAFCAANPAEYKQRYQANARAAGQGIGGNGIGGGGQGGVPGGFGTGGILGPGSPADADGAKNELYMQRTVVISSILNDPSLSIEDKIFYFMMWFAAFADKEREQKMKEIADLDRVDQQKKMMKDSIYRDRQALYESKKELTRGVETAEKDLGKLSPNEAKISGLETKLQHASERQAADPDTINAAKAHCEELKESGASNKQLKQAEAKVAKLEKQQPATEQELAAIKSEIKGLRESGGAGEAKVKDAKQKLDALKTKLSECGAKIEQKSAEFDQLKNETAQAPKSRELLFMELERIQRFRGMLIDMANSFMRDMARRVKEIMQ